MPFNAWCFIDDGRLRTIELSGFRDLVTLLSDPCCLFHSIHLLQRLSLHFDPSCPLLLWSRHAAGLHLLRYLLALR